MYQEFEGERGVTYIGPRSFVACFAVVCAVFAAVVFGASRFAESIESPPAGGPAFAAGRDAAAVPSGLSAVPHVVAPLAAAQQRDAAVRSNEIVVNAQRSLGSAPVAPATAAPAPPPHTAGARENSGSLVAPLAAREKPHLDAARENTAARAVPSTAGEKPHVDAVRAESASLAASSLTGEESHRQLKARGAARRDSQTSAASAQRSSARVTAVAVPRRMLTSFGRSAPTDAKPPAAVRTANTGTARVPHAGESAGTGAPRPALAKNAAAIRRHPGVAGRSPAIARLPGPPPVRRNPVSRALLVPVTSAASFNAGALEPRSAAGTLFVGSQAIRDASADAEAH